MVLGNQFGFMPGKSIMELIFCMKHIMKSRENNVGDCVWHL